MYIIIPSTRISYGVTIGAGIRGKNGVWGPYAYLGLLNADNQAFEIWFAGKRTFHLRTPAIQY